MQKPLINLLFSTGLLASTHLLAQDISVEITNLTHATYFTPLLVSAHNSHTDLFEVGTDASTNIQAMAEGGDLSGLIEQIEEADGEYVANPADGLLAPGESTQAMLNTNRRHTSLLSIVAMLLPTNDGFVGLDSLKIPTRRGTYSYYLNAYDAGTEANDEIITGGGDPNVPGIPADPGGNAGTGAIADVDADFNQTVHIHRGVLGDMDLLGGTSDLDSRIHRWQNPVARVVLKVGKTNRHDDD